MFGIICFCQNKNVLLQCWDWPMKKKYEKNYLCFNFFCFIILFIYRVGTETKTDIQICGYTDAYRWGWGADSGGADGADHNKK